MASLFPFRRRRSALPSPRRWAWAIVAAMLVAALRMVPGEAMQALDGMPHATAVPPRVAGFPERPGETFPGSAYFFAADAFGPVDAGAGQSGNPAVTVLSTDAGSPHLLQIERGPVALSMALRGATPLDEGRALQCMTNALYYEAGNEPEEGQRAVAQVILNRVASGRWPGSICAVVYQGGERTDRGCQFTFSCDGSMARIPAAAAWIRARRVAARALGGEVYAPAGLATFYHSLAVRPPWVDRVRPVAVVGAHIFYRLPGEDGAPATYRMRYSGHEVTQPGPYAFVPPPRPLASPPGPEGMMGWTMPLAVPAASPTTAAMVGSAPPAPAPLPYGTPAGEGAEPGSSGLPQSTVRPEYRNSGRVLH